MSRSKVAAIICSVLILTIIAVLYVQWWNKYEYNSDVLPAINNSQNSDYPPISDGTGAPNPATGTDKTVYTITGQFSNSEKHNIPCFSPDADDSIRLFGDSSAQFCFSNSAEAIAMLDLEKAKSLYNRDTGCLWVYGRANITITNFVDQVPGYEPGAKLIKVNRMIVPAQCETPDLNLK